MKDPELIVQYFPDSDTLRLGAGESPAEGETIAKWLMVEWSHDNEVTGVVLRNAAKVLRPYLFPETDSGNSCDKQDIGREKELVAPAPDGELHDESDQ